MTPFRPTWASALLGALLLAAPFALAKDAPAPAARAEELAPAEPASDDEASEPAAPPSAVIASIDFEAALGPLTKDRLFRDSRLGIEVVDVATGESVFSRQADRALVPASTMKIITAAAALRALGPAFRFTTDVYADGPIDNAGVLQGNLYVQGHGDPSMVVERLWKLLYDLKLEGVTKVQGDVIFDEGYFDTTYALTGWTKEKDLREGPSYYASTGALSVNFNTVALVIAPGPEVGKKARVQLETPAGDYVEVKNEVVTAAEGARRRLEIDREVAGGKMVFTVRGTIASDNEVKKYYRTVVDPTAHFMGVWEQLERMHGIEVKGKHKRGAVPRSAELVLQQRSVPLTAVLMDMNKYSNNFMAEQVLKAVGAETGGAPGSTAKGIAYVESYLDGLGIPSEARSLVNGSGLSRDAQVRPSVLTRVMVDMANDDKVGHEFRTSLSIAGWDGTLWRRLSEDPARVRGKTGTIDGVHCLTGYVSASDGHQYAFAFLANELRGGSSQARRLHDRFLRRMFNADAP